MPDFLSLVLTPLISAVVAAAVGAVVAHVRSASEVSAEQRSRDRAEMDAMREGIKSLLRGEIMHLHHECVKRSHTTTVEKEVMQRNYEAYTGLDGNGVVKTLYAEFMSLPTIDE